MALKMMSPVINAQHHKIMWWFFVDFFLQFKFRCMCIMYNITYLFVISITAFYFFNT